MSGDSILVLNVSGIGDFVDSTPALTALRRRRPGDRIVLAVAEKTLPLARGCPHVDEVVGLPTRPGRGVPRLVDLPRWIRTILPWRKQFDLVVSLYGVSSGLGRGFTTWLLAWIGAPASIGRGARGRGSAFGITLWEDASPLDLLASYLALVSLVPENGKPSSHDAREVVSRPLLWIPEAASREIEAWLQEQRQLQGLEGPWVVVALGGDRPSRRESPERAERWLALLQKELGVRPIIWGAASDPGLPSDSLLPHADARGRWDLVHSASLIGHADVVITTQSVAQHLVSVWDVPTVVLAGPADTRVHRPHLVRSPLRLVKRSVPCAPCYHHDCPLSGEDYKRCLTGIEPEEVLEAFRDVFRAKPTPSPGAAERGEASLATTGERQPGHGFE